MTTRRGLSTTKVCLLIIFFFFLCFPPVFTQETGNTSIAMLNYLATQTRLINSSNNNRLMLEDIYNKLINNTNPGIIDETTQDFLQILLDDIESFRIQTLQRNRLRFILENQRAQAITDAMPNPLYLLGLSGPGGLKTIMTSRSESSNLSGNLSGSLSGLFGPAAGSVSGNVSGSMARSFVENITRTITNPMKLIATISVMTLDSVLKYRGALDDANLDFLKDDWELDDRESATLHNLRSQTFSYMIDIARRNKLGLLDTLNEESIDNFVSYCMDDNGERRKQALEANQPLYSKYAPYYLELAKTYYELEQYADCINAIAQYENVRAPIFRKDFDYASVLPKVILSAFFVHGFDTSYITITKKYLEELVGHTNSSDWELRYFATQTYINLAAIDGNAEYLSNAKNLLLDNVTYLSKQQEKYLTNYLKPINETIEKGLTKDQIRKSKNTIKELKELRKTELPPLMESLVINHQTLLLVMNELNVSQQEYQRLNVILDKAYINPVFRYHFFENDYASEKNDFLLKGKMSFYVSKIINIFKNIIVLFKRLLFNSTVEIDTLNLTLPAAYLSPNSKLDVMLRSDTLYNEPDVAYTVDKVDRNKSTDIAQLKARVKVSLAPTFVLKKREEYTMHITITTNNVSSTMIFTSPARKSRFIFSSLK
ncbi:hypothetical protein FACS1894130_05630 [Spirochaetia bacterium]|nr:hypothetical protein FACS1894130_05630 [Spirochaetia bacterium]